MDDFAGLLQRDFGLKPQGKSSPMVSSKGSVVPEGGNTSQSSSAGNTAFPGGGGGGVVSGDDPFFSKSSRGFDEVFGGGGGTMGVPPKPRSSSAFSASSVVYDDIFKAPAAPAVANGRSFSAAVDAPIFDDDIFGGVPGVRKVSSSGIDDIFGRSSSPSPSPPPSIFDDLLGGFGASASAPKQTSTNAPKQTSISPMESFDDLLPGFGGMDPPKPRPAGGDGKSSSEEFTSKPASADAFDDLLPGFGSSDPLPQPWPTGDAKKSPEQTSSPFVDPDPNPYKENGKSNTVKTGLGGGRAEEGLPGFDEFVTSPPPPSATKPPVVAPSSKGSENPLLNRNIVEKKRSETAESPSRSSTRSETLLNRNIVEKKRGETVETPSRSSAQSDTLLNRNIVEKKRIETVESPSRSSTRNETLLNRNIVEKRRSETVTSPPRSTTRSKNVSEAKNNHSLNNNNEARSPKMERVSQSDSPRKKDRKSEESANQVQKAEKKRMGRDYWVSVENIKLATQPSSAPPPTRPLPLPKLKPAENLEAFAAGMSRKPGEDRELEGVASASAAAASAAAMKEAMDKAEAKAKQAKEREREAKLARAKEERERLREAQLREEKEQREKDERAFKERWEREEAAAREREEREAREEKEREAREMRRKEQLEKEKEREKERERRAVEKVNQEARERAAAEAQERMERAAKDARDRAAKEARDRAERVAVERATAEARERAAIDAKKAAENKARLERAAVERANAEARERAAAEARERAERIAAERAAAAAVERANAEAQERAAAEARERAERIAAERATAAAKENQRRQQDNDLESFFKSNSRADSTPRQRPATAVPTPDIPQPNRGFQSDDNRRPPPGPSEVKKPPASPIDDLTSLFGVARTSEDFQEVAGETAERRKARLERHQRTLDRTAKALEEKNQRDLQVQREQAERHRLAETVDAEIKRWSLGKEGNIRALLSTLQYVLWPECGWQPVSLTDLITGASVKKVYRKATLCVHPDKVQQKGATIQQKYISEKVFDLLKEAWNKFNSEELF